MDEWEGEKWLDVRQWIVIEEITVQRIKIAKEKGFVGVDWDNVDGYSNKTGFNISEKDQIEFCKKYAQLTKNSGLLVGLKNNADLVNKLH